MNHLVSSFLPRRPTILTLSATAAIASLTYIAVKPNSPQASLMSTSKSAAAFPVRPYTPTHTTFPYSKFDLTPSDPSSDADFYSSPRFVTHIDDNAISLLRRYYASILPLGGERDIAATSSKPNTTKRRPRVLDLCSSWICHYPTSLEVAARGGRDVGFDVAGTGMSALELGANPFFGGKAEGSKRWVVKDLNVDPKIPSMATLYPSTAITGGTEGQELLDATTLTVSIDYLTQPVAVLSDLLRNTRPGGTVHLAISNRCFPTKAVGRWLRIDEEERLQMVGDYLWFSGWREIEIVTLSDGHMDSGGEDELPAEPTGVRRLMTMMGISGDRCDPLWVVRGRKTDEEKGKI